MSQVLDRLLALAADFEPMTASLSPDTLAVLFYFEVAMQERRTWLEPDDPTDEITPAEWDTIEAMVATALKELMTPMIGQIVELASAVFPPNILPCDGATYNRVDYPDLYAVIDAVFIIDADTFFVPDLRDRVAIGESGTRAVGDSGGEETHTLTELEMPAHTHAQADPTVIDAGHVHTDVPALPNLTTIGAGAPQPTAIPGVGVTGLALTGISVIEAAIGSTGGDEAHNNMQPFLVLKKGIIAQ